MPVKKTKEIGTILDVKMHQYLLKKEFIENGKTIKITGSHTIKRGRKKVIHIQPGETLEAFPDELGKEWRKRFKDLGEVGVESTIEEEPDEEEEEEESKQRQGKSKRTR